MWLGTVRSERFNIFRLLPELNDNLYVLLVWMVKCVKNPLVTIYCYIRSFIMVINCC